MGFTMVYGKGVCERGRKNETIRPGQASRVIRCGCGCKYLVRWSKLGAELSCGPVSCGHPGVGSRPAGVTTRPLVDGVTAHPAGQSGESDQRLAAGS